MSDNYRMNCPCQTAPANETANMDDLLIFIALFWHSQTSEELLPDVDYFSARRAELLAAHREKMSHY